MADNKKLRVSIGSLSDEIVVGQNSNTTEIKSAQTRLDGGVYSKTLEPNDPSMIAKTESVIAFDSLDTENKTVHVTMPQRTLIKDKTNVVVDWGEIGQILSTPQESEPILDYDHNPKYHTINGWNPVTEKKEGVVQYSEQVIYADTNYTGITDRLYGKKDGSTSKYIELSKTDSSTAGYYINSVDPTSDSYLVPDRSSPGKWVYSKKREDQKKFSFLDRGDGDASVIKDALNIDENENPIFIRISAPSDIVAVDSTAKKSIYPYISRRYRFSIPNQYVVPRRASDASGPGNCHIGFVNACITLPSISSGSGISIRSPSNIWNGQMTIKSDDHIVVNKTSYVRYHNDVPLGKPMMITDSIAEGIDPDKAWFEYITGSAGRDGPTPVKIVSANETSDGKVELTIDVPSITQFGTRRRSFILPLYIAPLSGQKFGEALIATEYTDDRGDVHKKNIPSNVLYYSDAITKYGNYTIDSNGNGGFNSDVASIGHDFGWQRVYLIVSFIYDPPSYITRNDPRTVQITSDFSMTYPESEKLFTTEVTDSYVPLVLGDHDILGQKYKVSYAQSSTAKPLLITSELEINVGEALVSKQHDVHIMIRGYSDGGSIMAEYLKDDLNATFNIYDTIRFVFVDAVGRLGKVISSFTYVNYTTNETTNGYYTLTSKKNPLNNCAFYVELSDPVSSSIYPQKINSGLYPQSVLSFGSILNGHRGNPGKIDVRFYDIASDGTVETTESQNITQYAPCLDKDLEKLVYKPAKDILDSEKIASQIWDQDCYYEIGQNDASKILMRMSVMYNGETFRHDFPMDIIDGSYEYKNGYGIDAIPISYDSLETDSDGTGILNAKIKESSYFGVEVGKLARGIPFRLVLKNEGDSGINLYGNVLSDGNPDIPVLNTYMPIMLKPVISYKKLKDPSDDTKWIAQEFTEISQYRTRAAIFALDEDGAVDVQSNGSLAMFESSGVEREGFYMLDAVEKYFKYAEGITDRKIRMGFGIYAYDMYWIICDRYGSVTAPSPSIYWVEPSKGLYATLIETDANPNMVQIVLRDMFKSYYVWAASLKQIIAGQKYTFSFDFGGLVPKNSNTALSVKQFDENGRELDAHILMLPFLIKKFTLSINANAKKIVISGAPTTGIYGSHAKQATFEEGSGTEWKTTIHDYSGEYGTGAIELAVGDSIIYNYGTEISPENIINALHAAMNYKFNDQGMRVGYAITADSLKTGLESYGLTNGDLELSLTDKNNRYANIMQMLYALIEYNWNLKNELDKLKKKI